MKASDDLQQQFEAIGRELVESAKAPRQTAKSRRTTARPVDGERSRAHDSGVSDLPTRAEMEARLGEVAARTETQFEQLRGDIRELKASSASTATVIITAIALFAAIVGVIAALAATGWSGFGTGLSASDLANKAAERAVAQSIAARKGS